MAVALTPVRITVKSDLPEFLGLHIVQAPIEPDITWNTFFEFHPNISFKPELHALKSTRNVAYPEDTIQQTSDLFIRKNIIVHIIRANEAIAQKGRGRGRRKPRISKSGSAVISRARTSPLRIGQQNRVIPMPGMGRGRGGVRGRPANPPQLFAEGEESEYPHNPEQHDAEDNLMNMEDAASIASETDDIETAGAEVFKGLLRLGYSARKIAYLKNFSKFPNVDVDKMWKELHQMCTNGQRYKWSRRAPMASNAMMHCFNM